MRKTREERKFERSQRASRNAIIGWQRYHEAKAAAGIVEIYEDVHAYGKYEITIKSLRSGKINTLFLNEGPRRDNFIATLNGLPHRNGKSISISALSALVRKSIVKTRSGSTG